MVWKSCLGIVCHKAGLQDSDLDLGFAGELPSAVRCSGGTEDLRLLVGFGGLADQPPMLANLVSGLVGQQHKSVDELRLYG